MTAAEIAEAVAAGVKAALAISPAGPLLLYTPEQAEGVTGIPARWFKEKSATGQIPSTKVGNYRRFSLPQLLAIVEACEVLPTSGDKRKALIEALAEIKARAVLAA